jgi:hypothetical protein
MNAPSVFCLLGIESFASTTILTTTYKNPPRMFCELVFAGQTLAELSVQYLERVETLCLQGCCHKYRQEDNVPKITVVAQVANTTRRGCTLVRIDTAN